MYNYYPRISSLSQDIIVIPGYHRYPRISFYQMCIIRPIWPIFQSCGPGHCQKKLININSFRPGERNAIGMLVYSRLQIIRWATRNIKMRLVQAIKFKNLSASISTRRSSTSSLLGWSPSDQSRLLNSYKVYSHSTEVAAACTWASICPSPSLSKSLKASSSSSLQEIKVNSVCRANGIPEVWLHLLQLPPVPGGSCTHHLTHTLKSWLPHIYLQFSPLLLPLWYT